MIRSIYSTVFALAVVAYCVSSLTAQDWVRFRGSDGTGVSETAAPTTWSDKENLKWKCPLPGAGVSSPIVVGDKIFITCYSGYGLNREEPGDIEDLKRHVVCISRDSGKVIWDKTIDPVLPEDPYTGIGVPVHGYASHTPVSDGENVYAFLGKSGVVAFDMDGKQLWQTSVGTDSDPRKWGSASSPVLFEDLVIVPAICENMSLVALNKKTGEKVWEEVAEKMNNCWGTPVLVEVNDERSDLVFGVPDEMWGLNPRTGKMRWSTKGIPGGSFYTSVSVNDGVAYASASGRGGGGSLAVKVGGNGEVTESHVLWTGDDRSGYATPVIANDVMFLFSGGIATTVNAKTGERINRIRLKSDGDTEVEEVPERSKSGDDKKKGGRSGRRSRGGRGGFGNQDYSSPVIADDKVYYVKADGQTFVFSADEKFEQLAVNKVTSESEKFNGSPAISDGQIFLRSDKYLYCIEADK